MSGVFSTMGKISGIAASVLAFIPGMQPIAAAFAANAAIMGTLAQITAKKPVPIGSSTTIMIGASMPSPYIMGESYYGGSRVHQIGYGEEDDIPNAHAAIVDVYSVGGPLQQLMGAYADFSLVSFGGDNAIGYYHNNLHRDFQLGATPEFDWLQPHWSGTPDWGPSYKLSGKAAIFWNARFPKKTEVFRSGMPQFGAVWRGVKAWDPRADSTYPGGSGPQRWAPPSNTAAFAAARSTWPYTTNPGLHGLRYALGTWERNEGDPAAAYQLTFGMGLPYDGIIIADFVEFANVCEVNGWAVNGVIFEPGDMWENLKNICAAGAAEPCIKGGRLGLRITAPKISLDTITRADLADDDIVVPATRSYRERLNTIIPKYRSADHKWEYVASTPVKVLDYVAADGEERSEERQYNLVTDVDQAAQLAGYDLVNGRERFPIDVVCKPRLRRYAPGDQLTLDIPEVGLAGQECIIMRRSVDPVTMKVTLTLMEETTEKHAYALSLTGSSPPAISILPPGAIDGAVDGTNAETISLAIRTATVKCATTLLTGADVAGDGQITIAEHSWDYPDAEADVVRAGATLTGLSPGTRYYVYFDDASLADTTPTYVATTLLGEAINSTGHPARHFLDYVDMPGVGDPPSDGGGGGGGGGGGCPTDDMLLVVKDVGPVPVADIAIGMPIWARHQTTGIWGWYPITSISFFEDEALEATIRGEVYRTSRSHLWWLDGTWRAMGTLGDSVSIGLRRMAAITVEEAHTYRLLPSPTSATGMLSHNKVVNPDL